MMEKSIVVQEQFIDMQDGHLIYIRMYTPTVPLKGYVHIFHGMAEHCGRYDRFARFLCEEGYFVGLHDHRGHGRTAQATGTFGFIAEQHGFQLMVEDAHAVIQFLRKHYSLPIPTIFGHSMGSFIARRYIQLYSEIVTSAMICATGPTTYIHKVGQYVGAVLVKRYGARTASQMLHDFSVATYNKKIPNAKTPHDWITKCEDTVQSFIEDPLCGFPSSNQFYTDLAVGVTLIDKKTEMMKMRPELPVLFIAGTEDVMGEYGKGVFKVAEKFAKVGMQHVKVHLFEGMRHEILNEKQYALVYQVILRWLDKSIH